MSDITRTDSLRTQAVQACLAAIAGNPMNIRGHEFAGTRLLTNDMIEQQVIYNERETATSPYQRVAYTTTVTITVQRTVKGLA